MDQIAHPDKARRGLENTAELRQVLEAHGIPFAANDSIGHLLTDELRAMIEADVATAFEDVLDALVIDRDHNTRDTAKRVAKMYVREIFAGRYDPPPRVTEFPNAKDLDELYTVGPITVRSTCSHHFCPIQGKAWIGVIPQKRLIGLSKFVRLTSWIMSRPQIQEEAAVQLADQLEKIIEPRGLAVAVSASHSCMTMRGVKEHSTVMTTSVLRGIMFHDQAARAEFYKFVETNQ